MCQKIVLKKAVKLTVKKLTARFKTWANCRIQRYERGDGLGDGFTCFLLTFLIIS
jgi:hypothetical protein